jgi:hypothetical protein
MKPAEINVNLNAHEIGVILSALQMLSLSEERQIAKEYGSASALYNRLYSIQEQLDTSQTKLSYDLTPSY